MHNNKLQKADKRICNKKTKEIKQNEMELINMRNKRRRL